MPTPSFSPREAFAKRTLTGLPSKALRASYAHDSKPMMRRECFTRAWLRHCLLRGESPRALRMKWNRCRPTLSCGLRPAVPAALRLACDRPFYSTSGAQCVIRPSASRLSASCAQCVIRPPALSCSALGPRVVNRPRDSAHRELSAPVHPGYNFFVFEPVHPGLAVD